MMVKQVHQRASQHDKERKKAEQMRSVLRQEKESAHRQKTGQDPTGL